MGDLNRSHSFEGRASAEARGRGRGVALGAVLGIGAVAAACTSKGSSSPASTGARDATKALSPNVVVATADLGTRGTVLVDGVNPAYHRLHHAVGAPLGCNLGLVLTVWDLLSGRARWPAPHSRRAPTGLADRPVPVEQADRGRSTPGLLAAQLADPFVGSRRGRAV